MSNIRDLTNELHALAKKANVSISEVEKALGVSRHTFWTWREGQSPGTKAHLLLASRLVKRLEALLQQGKLPVKGPKMYSKLRGDAIFKVEAEKS